ncbi:MULTISPECIES: Pepco domain-containing protein [unclassified Streptomyces]|uniref:Pepco domain-containing protein n=1 Tax=Streptomyces sp. cf386 TaxID=1761904 RepID=UPI000882067D|nr:hypothetical protein [Streptomyces sp. cf386]SDP81306.1 hypothetical protein SAMN04487981_14418 [Streptomyces sp. cf386]
MESYVEDPADGQAAEELEFLVLDDAEEERRGFDKSGGPRRGGGGEDGGRVRRRSFKPADLNVQLNRTLNGLRDAFDGLQQAGPDGWGISEVQVSCQLTASGQLVVLGVGSQAQRTGGILLTLTPRPAGSDGSER